MNAQRFYRNLSIALFALNIGVLAFVYFGHKKGARPGGPPPRTFEDGQPRVPRPIRNIFAGDSIGLAAFQASLAEHAGGMRQLNSEKSELLLAYFGDLADSNVAIDSLEQADLLEQIENIETKRITITRKHLTDVITICPSNKTEECTQFVRNALQNLLVQKNNGPPKRRRRQ